MSTKLLYSGTKTDYQIKFCQPREQLGKEAKGKPPFDKPTPQFLLKICPKWYTISACSIGNFSLPQLAL